MKVFYSLRLGILRHILESLLSRNVSVYKIFYEFFGGTNMPVNTSRRGFLVGTASLLAATKTASAGGFTDAAREASYEALPKGYLADGEQKTFDTPKGRVHCVGGNRFRDMSERSRGGMGISPGHSRQCQFVPK